MQLYSGIQGAEHSDYAMEQLSATRFVLPNIANT